MAAPNPQSYLYQSAVSVGKKGLKPLNPKLVKEDNDTERVGSSLELIVTKAALRETICMIADLEGDGMNDVDITEFGMTIFSLCRTIDYTTRYVVGNGKKHIPKLLQGTRTVYLKSKDEVAEVFAQTFAFLMARFPEVVFMAFDIREDVERLLNFRSGIQLPPRPTIRDFDPQELAKMLLGWPKGNKPGLKDCVRGLGGTIDEKLEHGGSNDTMYTRDLVFLEINELFKRLGYAAPEAKKPTDITKFKYKRPAKSVKPSSNNGPAASSIATVAPTENASSSTVTTTRKRKASVVDSPPRKTVKEISTELGELERRLKMKPWLADEEMTFQERMKIKLECFGFEC